MIIGEYEEKFGKRWDAWTQDEWDEVLKVVEADDLKFPLLINKVMEAYMSNRKHVLTESVLAFVDNTISRITQTKPRKTNITEEQFRDWMKFYMEKAKTMLAERKQVQAIIFFHHSGDVVLFPCAEFMGSVVGKERLAEIGRYIAKKSAAEAVFFISEMWMAEYRPAPGEVPPPPKDLPERREALMVAGQAILDGTSKVEHTMHMQFFHRKGAGDPDEEIVYGEFKEMRGGNVDTRFVFLAV